MKKVCVAGVLAFFFTFFFFKTLLLVIIFFLVYTKVSFSLQRRELKQCNGFDQAEQSVSMCYRYQYHYPVEQ